MKSMKALETENADLRKRLDHSNLDWTKKANELHRVKTESKADIDGLKRIIRETDEKLSREKRAREKAEDQRDILIAALKRLA